MSTRSDRNSSTPVGPPVAGEMSGRWHPETLMCAFRGHIVPAAFTEIVDPDDRLIALPLSEHSHVARCLRCDAWVLADPSRRHQKRAVSLDPASIPPRGKELRDTLVLKLIAVDRGLHAVVFTIVAVGALLLESHLHGLQAQAQRLIHNGSTTLAGTGQGATSSFLLKQLDRLTRLKSSSVATIGAVATAYAVVEGVEAFGLWRARRWAEYLTALATAGFLPLEIHEIVDKVTISRVGGLIINVAVLIYLVFAKRLFGLRGGVHTDQVLLRRSEALMFLPGQPQPPAPDAPSPPSTSP